MIAMRFANTTCVAPGRAGFNLSDKPAGPEHYERISQQAIGTPIVRLAAARGWTVLFDECYDRFVYEGRHLSAPMVDRR